MQFFCHWSLSSAMFQWNLLLRFLKDTHHCMNSCCDTRFFQGKRGLLQLKNQGWIEMSRKWQKGKLLTLFVLRLQVDWVWHMSQKNQERRKTLLNHRDLLQGSNKKREKWIWTWTTVRPNFVPQSGDHRYLLLMWDRVDAISKFMESWGLQESH